MWSVEKSIDVGKKVGNDITRATDEDEVIRGGFCEGDCYGFAYRRISAYGKPFIFISFGKFLCRQSSLAGWLCEIIKGVGVESPKSIDGKLIIFVAHHAEDNAQGALTLSLQTIKIIVLGLIAFSISTVGGLLVGDLMYFVTGGKINPLIGSAGVSAVPMAARVSQDVGRKSNPSNYLLMHAMGPNVSGVIGSAIAAGFLLSVFGG